jgi:tetratricopeptide (TPR) repeat protein
VTAATPAPSPSPSAAPSAPADPGAELDALLGSGKPDITPTAKARILFAKAQLAFMRNQVAEQQKNYQAIADKFKPEDLSSILLAFVGDYLLSKGDTAKAKTYFDYLMDEYPKSDVLDYAYNGLAQIAFDKGDYDKALQYYNDAIDKGIAGGKLKELNVGKARTLLKLKRLDQAFKVFEEIAGIREWRGPVTAESIFSMGDIDQQQGKFNEAITYYQRVYVAYQRFAEWVAKAYLESGKCFEQLGKGQEAINTYKEMLKNDKLLKFPEADEARKRLELLEGRGAK